MRGHVGTVRADLVVPFRGHEEEDADYRDRADDGVGVGGGHGRAADEATFVDGRNNAGRGRGVGGDRKIAAAAAATAFAGAVASAAATTTKPACTIIISTTTPHQTIIGTAAVHDNDDETPLRGAGGTRLLQGRDDELGQGTDSFQHQLHGVRYHTRPHRDGGREVGEEGGRPFGQGEHIQTANE